jgi:hypothetical protein
MAEVEEITEQVADQIEEVAEITRRLTGREMGFLIAGTGVGIAVGFGVGYSIADRRLRTKYEKIAEQEVAEMREHYNKKLMASENKPSINELVKERYSDEEQEAINEVEEAEEVEDKPVDAVASVVQERTTVNVFEADEWNYDRELASRVPGVPYIIHADEFQENEPQHTQVTVTYYQEDDVLADVRDEVVEDQDAAVGLGNLGKWGYGSNDQNVVYVRNEELALDYEIVRDRGSYAEITAKTIRHSSTIRRRRSARRFDDE